MYIKDCTTGDGHVINMHHVAHVCLHDNQDHTTDILFYSVKDLICIVKYLKTDTQNLLRSIVWEAKHDPT